MTRTPDDRLDPSLRRSGVILLDGMPGILNSTMVAAGIPAAATQEGSR